MAPFLWSTPVHRADRGPAASLQNIQHGEGLGWGEGITRGLWTGDRKGRQNQLPHPPPTLGLHELRKNFFGTWAEVDTCHFPATPNPDIGTSLHTLGGNQAPVLGYCKGPDQQQPGKSRGEGKTFQKENKKQKTKKPRHKQRHRDRSVAYLGDTHSGTALHQPFGDTFSLSSKLKRQGYRL